MDEYLIYGDTLRKIAGEARRLISSNVEMDADEIYAALCKVSPGDGASIPSSDGVAFSSTQIKPDEDYRVNYNFMAQVVAHAQRMVGSTDDMTKEQILKSLAAAIVLVVGQAKSNLSGLTFETEHKAVVTQQVLSKAHLVNWKHEQRYVEAGPNSIQLKTSWSYASTEESIDVGRMSVIKIITSDLVSVESLEVSSDG